MIIITKWAGTFKPYDTKHNKQVHANEGKIGRIIVPGTVPRVLFIKQEWVEYNGSYEEDLKFGKTVVLDSFAATIHSCYLEKF